MLCSNPTAPHLCRPLKRHRRVTVGGGANSNHPCSKRRLRSARDRLPPSGAAAFDCRCHCGASGGCPHPAVGGRGTAARGWDTAARGKDTAAHGKDTAATRRKEGHSYPWEGRTTWLPEGRTWRPGRPDPAPFTLHPVRERLRGRREQDRGRSTAGLPEPAAQGEAGRASVVP